METIKNPSEGIPDSWKPYRDKDGNVVTITPDQCAAVIRAIEIVELVREKEGKQPLLGGVDFIYSVHAEVTKSCLLGRILYEGKPPHRDPPPVQMAAPSWHLVPGDDNYNEEWVCDKCGMGLGRWCKIGEESHGPKVHYDSGSEECNQYHIKKFQEKQ